MARKTKKSSASKQVFAKGTYIISGENRTEILDEVNENTPDHMIPSVPKPISHKDANKLIAKTSGGIKKEFDWTRVRTPRIERQLKGQRLTPKMPRLR